MAGRYKGETMSNVYAKDRKETQLAFFVNAKDLQIEITKFVMRDKVIPKKLRYAISYPLINKVDELVDNITYANSIYPVNEEELLQRKNYQTLAIANCYQIQNKLIRAEKCIETFKAEYLGNFIELVGKELELLKAWKKANKIIKK